MEKPTNSIQRMASGEPGAVQACVKKPAGRGLFRSWNKAEELLRCFFFFASGLPQPDVRGNRPYGPNRMRSYSHLVLAFLLLPLRGKRTVKIVPAAWVEVISIRPPCATMISRVM